MQVFGSGFFQQPASRLDHLHVSALTGPIRGVHSEGLGTSSKKHQNAMSEERSALAVVSVK